MKDATLVRDTTVEYPESRRLLGNGHGDGKSVARPQIARFAPMRELAEMGAFSELSADGLAAQRAASVLRPLPTLAGCSMPTCALVLTGAERAAVGPFIDGLMGAVNHYAPGSFLVDTVRDGVASESRDSVLKRLPNSSDVMCRTAAHARGRGSVDAPATEWLTELIVRWRATREAGRVLLLTLRPGQAQGLVRLLQRGDVVLAERNALSDPQVDVLASGSALADLRFFRLPDDAGARRPDRGDWPFRVTAGELHLSGLGAAKRQWRPSTAPNLDWIARWITGREVGIALGAGTAAGFAHLGVLQVLEEAGVMLDYLCGSSIGGAAALFYARFGHCLDLEQMACALVGSNDRIVDVSWFPRSSLLTGRKHRAAALALFGDTQIAELAKPAAAVATDLVRGEGFVLDRGLAATAARATTAIPGVFPPVPHDGHLLVDGGLVSRVPVDLLFRRGCGLKLAVSILPTAAQSASDGDRYRHLQRCFQRFLGFRSVIASAWQVMGRCQTAREALSADVLIQPRVPESSCFDFGTCHAMIAAGRLAAEESLDLIRNSVDALLKPGACKEPLPQHPFTDMVGVSQDAATGSIHSLAARATGE